MYVSLYSLALAPTSRRHRPLSRRHLPRRRPRPHRRLRLHRRHLPRRHLPRRRLPRRRASLAAAFLAAASLASALALTAATFDFQLTRSWEIAGATHRLRSVRPDICAGRRCHGDAHCAQDRYPAPWGAHTAPRGVRAAIGGYARITPFHPWNEGARKGAVCAPRGAG
jgi:hypothetical protein